MPVASQRTEVEVGEAQRFAGGQATEEVAVARVKRQRQRSAGGTFAVLGQMRGNAMLRQRPLQTLPPAIRAHLAEERNARAQRDGGERAIGTAAADRFNDG